MKTSEVVSYLSSQVNKTNLLKLTKIFFDKIFEAMTGGPSIVFTRNAVVDQTFIRKSENLCKSIVGIDASKLYLISMC